MQNHSPLPLHNTGSVHLLCKNYVDMYSYTHLIYIPILSLFLGKVKSGIRLLFAFFIVFCVLF